MTIGPKRTLSRSAGEFLLALLEQPRPAIVGSVLKDLDQDIVAELRTNGSLRQAAVSRAIQIVGDDGVSTVNLTWEPHLERYAYFDAADGWVAPDPEELKVYRLDSGWWLAWLATELALVAAGKPTELVADHAWDLGDIRISRKRMAPLLFARRLYAEDVRAELIAAFDRRRGRSGGVLLTTTRHDIEVLAVPGSHCLMSVVESLTSDAASFHIDVALIQGLYLGRAADATGRPALHLSPDGETLTIHGEVLHLRGAIQQSIIRQLVNAFSGGKRLRTVDVLARAGSAADALAKAFKGSPNWQTLRRYLRQERGFCWFEP